MAMELKLRSERKAGEFLIETKPELKRAKAQHMPWLEKQGIKRTVSQRWQRIAKIPEERFEEYSVNAAKRTQSALLSEAGRIVRAARTQIAEHIAAYMKAAIDMGIPRLLRKLKWNEFLQWRSRRLG